ncbi:hypothetical protein BGZ99_000747 [Dissophora globulifera]|uniref:Uncharacterized protein n=1 Tax=Dissophora globulifera TaxID=979702 RepID=A0A9P6R030_9FUNG|nr:hypothetical protein BGZ99_000747 [Dissophora globulifera]
MFFVIGSGSRTLPGLLQVSRMSGRASFSAHIHFPALPFIHFDQVFLQRHEVVVQLAALGLMKDQKNYFQIKSTLNTISTKSLTLAKNRALENSLIPKSFFASSSSTRPIATVLIGGPNEDCSHNTERMVNRITRMIETQDYRVLISFSQRTANNTKQAIAHLVDRIQDTDRIFVYDPMAVDKKSSMQETASWQNIPGPAGVLGFLEDRNPYLAMLELADCFVVTADSIAMTNEAVATGKPVYILGGELARGKLKVFHRFLADKNVTRAFRPGRIPISPTSTPNKRANNNASNDTADPLSYPGDHPVWNNQALAGQGPDEIKRLGERLQIMRECRVAGRRVPDNIAQATS